MPPDATPVGFALTAKVALVTGSGSGVGRALALAFAERGARLVCVGRRRERLERTVADIVAAGGEAHALATDVSDPAAVARLSTEVTARFGGVDLLCNNAGSFGAVGPLWEIDPEVWWRDVAVNLRGPMLLCRAFVPGMIVRRSGVIINLDGGGGACGPDIVVHRLGEPGAPRFNGANVGGSAYGASKAGLMRFTEGLARELELSGASVLAFGLNPGFVRTEMTEALAAGPGGAEWQAIVGRMFARGVDRPPTDCAAAALRLLAIAGPALNGCVFDVDTDFAAVAREGERIRRDDLYLMRLRTPQAD